MPQKWHHRCIIRGSLKHAFGSLKSKTTTTAQLYERGINGRGWGLGERNG